MLTIAAGITLPCKPSHAPKHMSVSHALVSVAPAGVTAFIDVAVVPMDRERVLRDQTVVVAGGRITALGPAQQVHVPAGATRIDGRGRYLIPGLADMHAHLFLGTHLGNVPFPMYDRVADSATAAEKLFLWLANGVTTIRNMDYRNIEAGRQALRFRALAASGQMLMPRIYTAGPWSGQHDRDHGWPAADSIALYMATYQAAGYDFIKAYAEPPHVLDSVLAVAQRIHLPVAGHVPFPTTVEHAIAGGYRCIEHPLTEWLWNRRTEKSVEAGEQDTSGIQVLATAMHRANVWHDPTQGHYNQRHNDAPNLLKVEHNAGVELLLGTDELPWQGVITRELQAFVAAGLTPYQALRAGTRNVAAYFRTLAESGTIAVGKRADLVLLMGNPLQDVRYTAQPAGVMRAGYWVPRAEIDRRLRELLLPSYTPHEFINPQPDYPVLMAEILKPKPIKGYWENMVDEVVEQSAQAMFLVTLTPAQWTQLAPMLAVHAIQRRALVDSLGESHAYDVGTRRVLELLKWQLGQDRAILTVEQQKKFDQQMNVWLRRCRQNGYAVLTSNPTLR